MTGLDAEEHVLDALATYVVAVNQSLAAVLSRADVPDGELRRVAALVARTAKGTLARPAGHRAG
ncbi:hypothetical protein AB0D24_39520 [Streptomyces javensis]|uniref:hypothetical protein n=1 Tax=Streptomyces javensis TaxID=114698 RepID=UPI0033C5C819